MNWFSPLNEELQPELKYFNMMNFIVTCNDVFKGNYEQGSVCV